MNTSNHHSGNGLKTGVFHCNLSTSVFVPVLLLTMIFIGSELPVTAQSNAGTQRGADSRMPGSGEEEKAMEKDRDDPPPSSVPTSDIPEQLRGHDHYYRLEYVLDGDSLLLKNGEELRLIGIDAPEKDQEFGDRSRAFVRSLLKKGALISVDYDQVVRDRYDRLLGYVFLLVPRKNGKKKCVMINELLLRKGLATIFLHRRNTKWKHRLITAQRKSLRKRKNLFHRLQENSDTYYSVRGHFRYHRPGCTYVRDVPDKYIQVFQSRKQALRHGCNSASCCLP